MIIYQYKCESVLNSERILHLNTHILTHTCTRITLHTYKYIHLHTDCSYMITGEDSIYYTSINAISSCKWTLADNLVRYIDMVLCVYVYVINVYVCIYIYISIYIYLI